MTVIPSEEQLRALAGWRFPGGQVRIPAYENAVLCDVVLDEAEADIANPLYGYLTPGAGMGISLEALFALVGASGADGPMHGECEIELHAPLRVETDYRIEGEIIDVVRKRGRKIGMFDMLRYRLAMMEGDTEVAATTSIIVIPRREA